MKNELTCKQKINLSNLTTNRVILTIILNDKLTDLLMKTKNENKIKINYYKK